MASLKSIEMDTLQSVKDLIGTYQNYIENFNDEKYAEINEYFIQPLVGKTNLLITMFEEMEGFVRRFSDEGIISEDRGMAG